MKRTLAAIGVAALGIVGLGVLASPASAEDTLPDCKKGTVHITDRPDSAAAGDYNWAKDTFDRKFEVCHAVVAELKTKSVEVPGWVYTVRLWDNGTFKTVGTKSPQLGATMIEGLSGNFNGYIGKDGLSVQGLFEAPANWQGWTAPTTTNTLDTSSWIKHLFTNGDVSTVQGLEFTWGWKYTYCDGEFWINADRQHGGNKGDITGINRIHLGCSTPPVFKDNCDGSVVVTLGNVAVDVDSKVAYKVSGIDEKVVVTGGKTVEVSTKPNDSGVVTVSFHFAKINKTWDHTWVQPKDCQSPSPSPSVSTSTPGTPGLPVTGFPTTTAVVGALSLLGIGIAVVIVARRRRVKFEA